MRYISCVDRACKAAENSSAKSIFFFKRSFATGLLSYMLIVSQVFAQDGRLVFALDLIRHGDRTSIHSIPNAPHSWVEGLGQLTTLGMQQEFQLGVQLHKKYIQETSLLPSHYVANTLYIRSTDYDRTLMSAQSLLMGLYPLGSGPKLPNSDKPGLPQAYQPIPIHTQPILKDQEFLLGQNPNIMGELLLKYVFPRADWKEKSAELEPNFPRWSQLTGITIENIFQLITIADTLHVYQDHHISLPKGMTKQEANKIIESGAWAFATLFKPQEVGDVTGKKLLATIKNYLKQASENKIGLKFVLFSAHDITILSTMSALHVPLNDPPPYAADLNFSLYEIDQENYTVRVSYNEQPILIPGCDELDCSLTQFLEGVQWLA